MSPVSRFIMSRHVGPQGLAMFGALVLAAALYCPSLPAVAQHRLPAVAADAGLCKFNGGKVRRRGAPKLCGEAQRTAPRRLELAEKQDDRTRRYGETGR